MPETPADTSDDAIRNRLFELMPKYPSKDACKMHLRREGFPSEHVERIVDETYAIRKQVVTQRITDEHALIGILVSILDGERQLPQDSEKLESAAKVYASRLTHESKNLTLQLQAYAVVVAIVAVLSIGAPQFMLGLVLLPLRRIWLAVAVYGAILGAIANAINSLRRLKLNKRRSASLRELASEQNWGSVRL